MCTSWVSFKQLCEQTDATLKKQLNMIKTAKTSYEPALDSFELVKDQSNKVPEDKSIKNETPIEIDEINDYENNLEDDLDNNITSDSEEEEDEELSSSSLEYNKSKKYQKKLKTKILQPKKSYYKPKNEFTCTTCTKTFRNAERLEAHVRQHLGQKVRITFINF